MIKPKLVRRVTEEFLDVTPGKKKVAEADEVEADIDDGDEEDETLDGADDDDCDDEEPTRASPRRRKR